jgi:hypothetical protein
MADAATSIPRVADYSEWRPRDYYDTYYSQVILPDEQAVLSYQISAMRSAGRRFNRALEYGCGPTLHRAIAASSYVNRIDMSDWLADNLVAVSEWVAADSHNEDWRRFTRSPWRAKNGRGAAFAGCMSAMRAGGIRSASSTAVSTTC